MCQLKLFIRASLFYLGFVISTLICMPISLLLLLLPQPIRCRVITETWTRFNLWWLKQCCQVEYEVSGQEHIPPRPGVMLCKHQSVFETLALQRLFMPHIWVLKRELLYIPVYGWGLAVLQPIAIRRRFRMAAFKQLLRQGQKQLALGRWVMIFPEATRVAPGETRPYQIGGAMLANHAKVSITPVSHNAGYLWPRRSFIKNPGKIRLVIGPAITSHGQSNTELIAAAQQWIESTAADLPDPRDGPPALQSG